MTSSSGLRRIITPCSSPLPQLHYARQSSSNIMATSPRVVSVPRGLRPRYSNATSGQDFIERSPAGCPSAPLVSQPSARTFPLLACLLMMSLRLHGMSFSWMKLAASPSPTARTPSGFLWTSSLIWCTSCPSRSWVRVRRAWAALL